MAPQAGPTPSTANERLTLLLPLFVDVRRRVSDLDRFLALGLPSLQRHLDRDLVAELVIVTPRRDLARVRARVEPRCPFRLRVLADEAICPAIDGLGLSGWYRQQLLKLGACARWVGTAWCLVLDADVVCVRPVDRRFLFPEGLAIRQHEQAAQHWRWWQGSLGVLNSRVALSKGQDVFGLTPALLHAPSVAGLLSKIERVRPRRDWAATLAQATRSAWTEYTLYWIHLLEEGLCGLHATGPRNLYAAPVELRAGAAMDDTRLAAVFAPDAPHAFLTFQSHLNLPLHVPVGLLRPRMGGRATLSPVERFHAARHGLSHGLARALDLPARVVGKLARRRVV